MFEPTVVDVPQCALPSYVWDSLVVKSNLSNHNFSTICGALRVLSTTLPLQHFQKICSSLYTKLMLFPTLIKSFLSIIIDRCLKLSLNSLGTIFLTPHNRLPVYSDDDLDPPPAVDPIVIQPARLAQFNNVVANQPNVIPQNVLHLRSTLITWIHKQSSCYRPVINYKDKTVRKTLVSKGLTTETSHENLIQNHPYGRAIRAHLTAVAISHLPLYPDRNNSIVLLYGANRDVNIFNRCVHARPGVPFDFGNFIRLIAYAPVITANDACHPLHPHTNLVIERNPAQLIGQTALLIDVFNIDSRLANLIGLPPDHTNIDPIVLTHLMQFFQFETLLFVCPLLAGIAGILEDGGYWYNDIYKPDNSPLEFREIFNMDWLYEKNYHYIDDNLVLVWCLLYSCEAKGLVSFNIVRRANFVPNTVLIKPSAQIVQYGGALLNRYLITSPWVMRWCSWLPESLYRSVYIDQLLACRVPPEVGGNQYTDSNNPRYNNLRDHFTTMYSAGYVNLINAHPEFQYLVSDTLQVALLNHQYQLKQSQNLLLAPSMFDICSDSLVQKSIAWCSFIAVSFTALYSLRRYSLASAGAILHPYVQSLLLFSNVLEELLKEKVPFLRRWFGPLEYLLRVWKHGSLGAVSGLAPCAMHLMISPLPFPLRVFFHTLYNFLCCLNFCLSPPMSMRPTGPSQTIYDYSTGSVLMYHPITAISVVSIPTTPIPASESPRLNPWLNSEVVTVSDTLIDQQTRPSFGYYPICVFAIPMFVPARSEHNLRAVVLNRLGHAPPIPSDRQNALWQSYEPILEEFYLIADSLKVPAIACPQLYADFIDHLSGAKKRQYTSVLNNLIRNKYNIRPSALRKTKVFIKRDEMILRTDLYWSPRVIMDVDPTIQIICGSFLLLYATQLKREPFKLPDSFIYLYYCAGIDVSKLNSWYNHALALPQYIHIFAAGDDCMVLFYSEGKWLAIEGDASRFDSTVSRGPLEFELTFLSRMGLPERQIKILRKSFANDLVAQMSRGSTTGVLRLSREHRPLRNTGGPDTSMGNTLTMLAAWFIVLKRDRSLLFDLTQLERVFHDDIGFIMRMKVVTPITVTFLKGFFCYNSSHTRVVWTPLPSRVLKMGKALRDPRQIYKESDLIVAARKFLNDVAFGISRMSLDPILRAWVKHWAYSAHQFIHLVDDWHYSLTFDVSDEQADPLSALEFIYARYQISADQVQDFIKVISATDVFTLVNHPVATRLLEVDY